MSVIRAEGNSAITRLLAKFKILHLMQLTEKDQIAIEWLTEKAMKGEISQAGLVQIFELAASLAHIYTKSKAAKITGVSYNGVKHRVIPVNFFGAKLVAIIE
jgi:hypothetical protein